MLKTTLAALLLSTTLVANSVAPVFAGEDGPGATYWEERAKKKVKAKKAKAPKKVVAKKKAPKKAAKKPAAKKPAAKKPVAKKPGDWITARNRDGSTISVRSNGDGTRTIIERGSDGQITDRRTVGQPTPDFAYNHTDGVLSVDIGGGTHMVIGPNGISFSN